MMRYDIMHFEALGKEAEFLKNITEELQKRGSLPASFTSLITPLTIQEYLKENTVDLPDIITTKTHSKLPNAYVNEGIKKSVITRSAGYDHFEHLQYKINLASLREYCIDAVAQTAIKFLYCTAGNLNEYSYNTKVFERKNTKSFMELGKSRIATVYGVGKIGKRVYEDLEANGLTVQAVDIRENELKQLPEYKDCRFTDRDTAIANSDILINVMNLTKDKNSRFYNEGYFDEKYLLKAKKPLIFINVTRGEIAPEATLLKLYGEGKITGIAADVFSQESELTDYLHANDFTGCRNENILAAKEIIDEALSRKSNFYVQPHQGFNSDIAAKTKATEAMNHVVFWLKNGKDHFKEQLPYYK